MSEYLPVDEKPQRPDADGLLAHLPTYLAMLVKVIPEDTLALSEAEMQKQIQPDATLERLRLSFWAEFDRSCRTNTQMNLASIYSGIATRNHFDKIVRNTFNLAYLITAPVDYEMYLLEGAQAGLQKMRAILDLSPLDDKGNPNPKLIKEQREIWLAFQDRAKGSVVRKVAIEAKTESKNFNVNQQLEARDITGEELDKQIQELEKKLELSAPPVIELEAAIVETHGKKV